MNEQGAVILVEFLGEHPFSVTCLRGADGPYPRHDTYDIEWCERDGVYTLELSGGAPAEPLVRRARDDTRYWAAPGVDAEGGEALTELPAPWTLERLFTEPFSCSAVFCSECNSFIPLEPGYLCEHVYQCEDCDELSTPDDRCECVPEGPAC